MKTTIFLMIAATAILSGCASSSLMPYDDNFKCRLSKKEQGMCGTMGQVHIQIIKEQEGDK